MINLSQPVVTSNQFFSNYSYFFVIFSRSNIFLPRSTQCAIHWCQVFSARWFSLHLYEGFFFSAKLVISPGFGIDLTPKRK